MPGPARGVGDILSIGVGGRGFLLKADPGPTIGALLID